MDLTEDPERGIAAHIMLADAAQVAEGKLSVLGAGWTFTGPMPTPFAVAIMMEFPLHETNRQHHLRLEVIDMDGTPFSIATPQGGQQPIVLEANLTVPRPEGHPYGFPVSTHVAINTGPIPFPPDSYFEWRLMVDGKTNADWRRAFRTRPLIQSDSAQDAEAA